PHPAIYPPSLHDALPISAETPPAPVSPHPRGVSQRHTSRAIAGTAGYLLPLSRVSCPASYRAFKPVVVCSLGLVCLAISEERGQVDGLACFASSLRYGQHPVVCQARDGHLWGAHDLVE